MHQNLEEIIPEWCIYVVSWHYICYIGLNHAVLKTAKTKWDWAMRITDEKPFRVVLENDSEIYALEDDSFGLCLSCGADHYTCEPDAERYHCEDCGENRVYGIMHLAMNGRVVFE